MRNTMIAAVSLLGVSACAQETTQNSPQDAFFASMAELCGSAFAGNVVSTDPQDEDWRRERLVMHVRECSEDEIRIPLHVGKNRSRTWVISRTGSGLRLKHDHRHEDGEPDAVTMYGGDTTSTGTAFRQEFPADNFSKELFIQEGLNVSVDNTWALEIDPGKTFSYELTRPNRMFRAQFDLGVEVPAPPPAWGDE